MKRLLFAILFVSFVAKTWPAKAAELYIDPLFGYSLTSDVVYGIGNTSVGPMQLKLDVYQPTNIGQGYVQADRPAVVIQDGGAWTSGSKTNGRVTTPAIYLAQRGFTVFVADYRQALDNAVSGAGPWQNLTFSGNGSGMGGLVSIYPGANVIRAGIEDFAAAITYTRNNAATYGIDPNRIAIAGGSAGAVNAMDLQYNNNPVNASYRAQAVVALVGTMYGDWDKMQPGGPPLFLWNNALDPVIWYTSDVEPNLHNRLESTGTYYEQWMEDPNLLDHNVHYEQHPLADTGCPWLADKYGDTSETALERMRDFLAYHFTGASPTASVITTVSTGNQAVVEFNHSGQANTLFPPGSGLQAPLGVAVDRSGVRYVVDWPSSRVYQFDAVGHASVFADASKGISFPTGVATAADQSVYVSNFLARQVIKIDSQGQSSVFSDASKGLDNPFAMAVSPTGQVFVVEPNQRQILKLDATGHATVFVGTGAGLLAPISIAFGPDGSLYVSDLLLQIIAKFDSQGNGTIFADQTSGIGLPIGITVDSLGYLYSMDYTTGKIIEFSPSGQATVFSAGNGLVHPFGIAADPLGQSAGTLGGASLAAKLTAVPEANSLLLVLTAGISTAGCYRLGRRSRTA